MAILKRRTRVVNFRLSEEEYRYLKDLYLRGKIRSVSEFARAAVCGLLGDAGAIAVPERLDRRVQKLQLKIQALERKVRRLAALAGKQTRAL
jgi:Arc/MetJ-type ribon-helix-helix transcriptional regulator